MKLASFAGAGGPRLAAIKEARAYDVTDWVLTRNVPDETRRRVEASGQTVASTGMVRLLQAGPEAIARLSRHVDTLHGPVMDLASLPLLAPVPRPGKIVAIGRNYADHALETGFTPLDKPRIISKLPSSVTGPNGVIPRPAGVAKLDFEIELAVVIGQYARHIEAADALGCVAGYTILNDLSAREFQFDITPAQTTFAKSMDCFAPMGPWMVTADEIGDPQTLDLSCSVNGETMQRANSCDMLLSVAQLIAYISRFMTLEPGDILATGTPAGVGAFRDPPRYLQPGDELLLEISSIGSIRHRIG